MQSRRVFIQTLSTSALVIVGGASHLSGEQTPNRIIAKSGLVDSIMGEGFVLTGSEGKQLVLSSKASKVWKKNAGHDFSDVRKGDQVLVRGHEDSFGNFIADEAWINLVSFYGRIINVNGNDYTILLYQPTPNGEQRKISVANTTLGGYSNTPLRSSDIKVGRFAQTIGYAEPNGNITAVRVIVSENGKPLDFQPGSKVISPETTPSQ